MKIPLKKTYFLGILVAAVVAIVLGLMALNAHRDKKEPLHTAMAEKKDVVDTIQFRGTVVAARKVPISAEASGQVVKLHVRQGERVEKGQPLLEIDPTQLSGKVERQKLLVEKSQVTFSNSIKEMARADELFKESLITQSQLEDFRKTKDLAKLDADLAQKELDVLNQQLGKVVIRSPIAGIVTAKNVEEGEVVVSSVESNAGKVLLVIADDTNKSIEAMVSDVERTVLKMGQAVAVWLDADESKRHAGKIVEMDEAAAQADDAATGGRAMPTLFRVGVEIQGASENFILGSNVTLEATLQEARGVLSIPIEGLFRDGQNAWVYAAKGSRFERQPVEAGVSSVERVEIKKGLEAGQKILLEEPPAD